MNGLLSEVAQAVSASLLGEDVRIKSICTDSRQIQPGCLFVALKGGRFDGHSFLEEAKAAGVAAVLVSESSVIPAGMPAIVVDDTRLALGRLAGVWRTRFELPVIAITGSNGKTTTKEMVAAILRSAYGENILATQGNFNNDIGLPLTLFRLESRHRAVVLELGMNHPGEIAYLTRIARPTAAVVTNAQRAHLEGMGDLDEIAREKGTIYEGLQEGGRAVIALDSPFAGLWQRMAAPHTVLGFSLGSAAHADIRGSVTQRGLHTSLHLTTPAAQAEIALQVPGIHNAHNALAAAAVCLGAGVPLEAVVQGLSVFKGVTGRLQVFHLRQGALLLNDTYNANPDSVRAGIDVLAATVGRKILVLGDMGEIGAESARYHDEVGGYAKSQGVDLLLTLGESSEIACRAFGEGGQHFRRPESLLVALGKRLTSGSTVLVKGSRFMKMEQITEGLLAQDAAVHQVEGE